MNIKKQEQAFISKVSSLPAVTIPLYLNSQEELIDSNNFAGPENYRLRDDIIEYLDQAAKETPLSNSIQIKIYFRENTGDSKINCEKIIHDYYAGELDKLVSEHKQNSKQWRFRFFTGLIVLAVSNAISFAISSFWESNLSTLIQQGLEVLGCVAIWEPSTYFLFSRKDEGHDISDYFQLKHSKIFY